MYSISHVKNANPYKKHYPLIWFEIQSRSRWNKHTPFLPQNATKTTGEMSMRIWKHKWQQADGKWKPELEVPPYYRQVSQYLPVLTQKLKWRPDAPRKSSREAFYLWPKEQERGLLWVRRMEEINPLGFFGPKQDQCSNGGNGSSPGSSQSSKNLILWWKNLVLSRRGESLFLLSFTRL